MWGRLSRRLSRKGPTSDALWWTGSKGHNLKELRPGSGGTSEIRILFVFDPDRNAVLLVAGNKSGKWREWYSQSIPVAEGRYDDWLAHLTQRQKGTSK